jgi:predicted alpha-1,6-mannanase (GH76 family)
MVKRILMVVVMAAVLTGVAGAQVASGNVANAVATLQKWYVPETGIYRSTGWWNSANVIATLANYSRVAKRKEFLPVFANTLEKAQTGPDGALGFLNKYYDDEGWWALAWIDVYDLTGEEKYLRQAWAIFKDMQLGWEDDACGGGVWWSKDKKDKNAIENELFLSVAASLANRERETAARDEALLWMRREWVWFRQSGMLNHEHLINDGLKMTEPGRCTNNGKRTWTYNQGVILGGLVEMSDAEKKAGHSDGGALKVARLKDPHDALGEPDGAHDGADVPQFKGILARNLMVLNDRLALRGYRRFVMRNAELIWSKDRNEEDQLGFWWGGPFDRADAARQSAALDLLVAADAMEVESGKR